MAPAAAAATSAKISAVRAIIYISPSEAARV
jgi:hypothetical protein